MTREEEAFERYKKKVEAMTPEQVEREKHRMIRRTGQLLIEFLGLASIRGQP